jgi:hypothetical protein
MLTFPSITKDRVRPREAGRAAGFKRIIEDQRVSVTASARLGFDSALVGLAGGDVAVVGRVGRLRRSAPNPRAAIATRAGWAVLAPRTVGRRRAPHPLVAGRVLAVGRNAGIADGKDQNRGSPRRQASDGKATA